MTWGSVGVVVCFKIKGQTFCEAWFILSRRRPGRINNLRMQSSPGNLPPTTIPSQKPTYPEYAFTRVMYIHLQRAGVYSYITLITTPFFSIYPLQSARKAKQTPRLTRN